MLRLRREFGIRLSTNAADAERHKFLVQCSNVVPPKVNVSTGRALNLKHRVIMEQVDISGIRIFYSPT